MAAPRGSVRQLRNPRRRRPHNPLRRRRHPHNPRRRRRHPHNPLRRRRRPHNPLRRHCLFRAEFLQVRVRHEIIKYTGG